MLHVMVMGIGRIMEGDPRERSLILTPRPIPPQLRAVMILVLMSSLVRVRMMTMTSSNGFNKPTGLSVQTMREEDHD
jgi:hypothetical protein